MPEGNPLVAAPVETTNAATGIGIAESAMDLANGVSDGSWVEAGLGAAGVGLEVLSMVIDPVGTLLSYGVGWIIEHFQPLKEALDWLAGDPPEIRAFSETWANVAEEVSAITQEFLNEVNSGTSGWTGQAADSYRAHGAEVADALSGASSLAGGISTGVAIMGEVVAAVRELVREIIAELVGRLIAWAAEIAASLGFATPVVVAQAVSAITKTINTVSTFIRKLIKTIGNVSPLIRNVVTKLDEIIGKLSTLMRGADAPSTPNAPNVAPTTPSSIPDTPTTPSAPTTPSSTPDAPTTRGPDGPSSPDSPGTTPSGTSSPDTTTSPNGSSSPSSVADNNTNPSANSRTNESTPRGGDPIDLATGRMFQTMVDFELAGKLPLTFVRAHRSDYRAGRWFGASWSSTLDQKVEVTTDAVHFAADDGMLLKYPIPGEIGSVLPVQGTPMPLSRTDDGGFTISADDRTLHFAPRAGVQLPISAISDRNGNRIDVDYDADGAPVQIRHSGGYRIAVQTESSRISALRLLDQDSGPGLPLANYRYDEAGRLVEVVNSSRQSMRFEYDQDGRITRWEDRNGMWYRFAYDAEGRCVRGTGRDGCLSYTFEYDDRNRITRSTNSLGNVTTYHLNDQSQIVREVDPLGDETLFEWDGHHRLVSRTDPLGRRYDYTYDEAGHLVVSTRPDGTRSTAEYNDLGLPITVVDPDEAVWHQEYDERGNLTAVVDPTQGRTTYTYGESGQLLTTTDVTGRIRRYQTDAAGLPVVVTTGKGATTRFDRDAFGRVSAITDPVGGVTRFGWTVEGRPAMRVLPDGATERWSYDGEGNAKERVDAMGRVSRTEISHFDLPVAHTGPDGARLEFAYDTELRVTAVTDPRGLVWRYSYDSAGRVVREVDFDGRELTYRYDAAGQVVERTNGAGQTVSFRRDPFGRVVERRAGDALTSFEYDPAGRMTRAVNADAELVFERDAFGRVVAETCNGRTVRSSYDVRGRRTHRVTPSGAESVWEYDENNQPVALHTAGRTLRFGYDAAGREIERHLGVGATLTQTWDANHRLTTQALTTPDGDRGPGLIQRRSYRYHLDGNVAAVVDQLAGLREYDVDPIGRVTAVRGRDWTERYSYDASGNITVAGWPAREDDAVGDRSYAGNLIRQAGNVRYQHDAEGRVVLRQHKTLSSSARNWHYAWDAESRLVGVVTPDGQQWRYRYDPLGRRIAKERLDGAAVVERVDFAWDGEVLAEQTHSSRTTVWDWEPGGFRPVSQLERESVDERFYAIVTDLVGTPTELVDWSGALAWRSQDTLWGAAPATPAGEVATPLRFPGQYFDQETQLNYNYHRYYDPASARYLSNDPLGLAPAPNPQAYVSNPTASFDPLGLAPYNLYRGMRTEGDLPRTGPSARTLGARPGTDVTPDADGMVHPGGGGISIAPETANNLPSHRRPPEFGGTGRDPVWSIDPDDLPEGLAYRRDSPTSGHGVIEPSRTMTYEEYQSLIESTAGSWNRVDP
ncbi:DUF6531 domain-containing protein [Actinophytocola sp.]|uniref:DUF6531 domain-containing protein n=1 Tax=Actinophytocola sp. TaxID=1872138 RepID=UPI003D6AD386